MRSLLLVSGTTGLGEGLRSGADALVIPASTLDRTAAADARREHGQGLPDDASGEGRRPLLIVKVGPVRSGLADVELDAAVSVRPAAIWLTDTVGGRDIQHLAAKLAVREAELGLVDGSIGILACLDSAAGILSVAAIAGATARLRGVTWDPGRLARDMGMAGARDRSGAMLPPIRHARSTVLFAAAAAGLPAIDGVREGEDERTLRTDCLAARRDGFRGKLAAHPSEVAVIDEVFAGS